MKIFVTGAAGFIGSNLIKILNKRGFCDLTLLDDNRCNTLEYLKGLEFAKFHSVDLRGINKTPEILAGHDLVIHLAAAGSVVESVNDAHSNFQSNVVSTFNLLEACRISGVKKFIFSSTGGALMGNAAPPVNEESAPQPISPYGASKLSCEGYCSAFSSSYEMDITVLRFANIVGSNSFHKRGAVTRFIKAVMHENPIEIYGDGGASRDFLHVDDLCEGILAVIEKESSGFNLFHLASGVETEIRSLAELVIKLIPGSGTDLIFLKKRSGEVERNFASYGKAAKIINFKPKRDLSEAILDTYKSFCEIEKR